MPLTTDHKPDEAQEKLRIYHVGGFINESRRVDGILTLSRSVGDNYLQPHVTYCPDVCFVDLIPEGNQSPQPLIMYFSQTNS